MSWADDTDEVAAAEHRSRNPGRPIGDREVEHNVLGNDGWAVAWSRDVEHRRRARSVADAASLEQAPRLSPGADECAVASCDSATAP